MTVIGGDKIVPVLEAGKTYDDLVKLVFGIRLCISSGYGDFGITSIVC